MCSSDQLVDSLHNQCLLRYDVLPISIAAISGSNSGIGVDHYPYFFCSSWTVPPLLGFAYVVLGGVLPRIVELLVPSKRGDEATFVPPSTKTGTSPSPSQLQTRAIIAVLTTAMIIKLSEYLETHPGIFGDGWALSPSEASLSVMIAAAIAQWAVLDGSIVALLVAVITAIGGPLAELPFVGHGVWTYLEEAANYFPLRDVTIFDSQSLSPFPQLLFGTKQYRDLALSSITGPCYFAVAMDAIALGRWFDSSSPKSLPSSTSDEVQRY